MSNHVLRRVAIAPIRIYQQVISPLLPDACIYYPTWLAIRRPGD